MKMIWFIRSCLMTLLIPVLVIVLGPSAILCNFLFRSRKIVDWHLAVWGKLNCWIFGIQVKASGFENIPEGGCLYLFNHSSFFDVFAISGYIPGVRFGAKAELFKIPIFSHTMRMMGTLPIARQNREEVYKVYDEAKARFKNKEKFALSPEGGRFYGQNLAPFKAGPFVFAITAGVPVVPVVITGAFECLPKGHILANKDKGRRTIELQILKPIETTDFDVYTRQQLQYVVYSKMNPLWVEYNKKVGTVFS